MENEQNIKVTNAGVDQSETTTPEMLEYTPHTFSGKFHLQVATLHLITGGMVYCILL